MLRAEGFLSEVAAPGAVKALSSSYLRTQRSAQLVMLGLEEASEGPTQVHGIVQVPPEDKDAINGECCLSKRASRAHLQQRSDDEDRHCRPQVS